MSLYRESYIQAIQAWDRKHRLVGQTPVSELVAQSEEAIASLEAEHPTHTLQTLIDIGAGSGLLGIPWVYSHMARKAVMVEPDPKKAAFLVHFLSSGPGRDLAPRIKILAQAVEGVSRETIAGFAPEGFFGAARAFSGNKTLEEALLLSQLAQDSHFRFEHRDKERKYLLEPLKLH